MAALYEDAHLAACIFDDASVSVWGINEKRELYHWQAEALDEASLHLISFSKNKAWMALTGHWSTTLINLHSGEELASWEIKHYSSEATTHAITLNNDGDVVSLSSDGVLQS